MAVLAAGVACLALVPGTASALTLNAFSNDIADVGGDPFSQAGGHPGEVTTSFGFDLVESFGAMLPEGAAKDISVDLPPGLVGDPTGIPRCTGGQLLDGRRGEGPEPKCPIGSQVGTAYVESYPLPFYPAIFNMEPREDEPARFGMNVSGVGVFMVPKLRTGGDYGLTMESYSTSQVYPLLTVTTSFWGVPADPEHDAHRGACSTTFSGPSGELCPSPEPRRPFLTNPTRCSATPLTSSITVNSWEQPGVFDSRSTDRDAQGNAAVMTGCDRVPFDPSLSLHPTTTEADQPTGLDVTLSIPQNENPDGVGAAHLRNVSVTLPEGMTVSPSAADGLTGCAPAGIGIDNDRPVACPASSRIGSVEIETPLLDDPLTGDVYVATQNANPFGSLLAIYVVARGPGVLIKLPGRVDLDPATGRITTTFDNNPQLPFDEMRLRFNGGPRAPLATPTDCGTKTVEATLTSWAGHTVDTTDSFEIACPGQGGFAPSLRAGTVSPTGGAFSPFVARIARDDRQQFLSGVSVDLPEGLMASLRGVSLCDGASAAGGTCSAGSRVGTATVAAGPGSTPFHLQGDVFLTEGYKGAPYGLAVHVHAKAGPLDLGMVRVRQALYVDPVTAKVSVVSDPLPRILEGVPIRLRDVAVEVDRHDFTINPTSCAVKQIGAVLTAIDGTVHRTASRFQAGDCQALGFKPRLAMRLIGKKQTKTGGHPTLRAVVSQGAGQANIGRAEVALPKSVVLDPNNSTDPKLVCGYDEGLEADCPATSIVGSATATTPLLNKPLTGKVHLVQGIRFGKNGNRIRTTPTLLVRLRGEVPIDLRAKTTVKKSRLVTIFPQVPDARVSKFSMRINGGKKGILVVTRTRKAKIDLCKSKQVANVEKDAHNGKHLEFATTIKTPCAMKKPKKAKRGRAGP